ncbi:hypothetical protein GGS23DRAFT_293569 [Durotheca rogersii]|uniref:uncharacterized protein n=1 Tax=Durotheca rogersii TaxID=419775 RepID=UPI0022208E9E|nr:uncharacterized protein GGS23DRAFT_293569 [Durotheca rogersii]KAI5866886.1 hypothetical protein GGS23DRAFT_293569 [Durotheca rogersii]
MPHPFHPDDFPINTTRRFQPTRVLFLKGCIHFKTTAQILELTGSVGAAPLTAGGDLSSAFLDEAERAADHLVRRDAEPLYQIASSGNMMRTLKTLTRGRSGAKVADLNMTFVSFDSSSVRFPRDSPHCRHEVEICPVSPSSFASTSAAGRGDSSKDGADARHEAFVRHSIPYFWDLTRGRNGVLYKCLNQQRVEVARVTAAGRGSDDDAILVFDSDELDDAVTVSTCIVLLNGRDAIDT